MDFSPADVHSKNLFKRCYDCAPVITASCPVCPSDQFCALTAAECYKCPEYQCVSNSDGTTLQGKSGGGGKSPVAGIVGGVAGGIVAIILTTFIVWKFCLKGRRRERVEDWDELELPMEKPGNESIMLREARSRASTHTVTSMASTVLTRASNIIQIAYIPGVTNRQASTAPSPDVLVPPVPPIPIPTTPSTPNHTIHDEQLLFLPGDLRDSTYSDLSSLDGARQSIAPSLARSSIATTIFREDAVPTQVIKLKPSVVSVRSNPNSPALTSDSASTPPLPSVNHSRFETQHASASTGRPIMLRIPSSSDGIASPSGSIRSMKPTELTITRKKSTVATSSNGPSPLHTSTIAEPLSAPSVDEGEKEEKASGLGVRPTPRASVAETQTSAESPHARAKYHMADDDSSDDDSDTSDGHQRSRRSLLSKKKESPFTDAAEAKDEEEPKPSKKSSDSKNEGTEERRRSPFEDENAV